MFLPKKAVGLSLLTLGLLGSCGKSYLELQPRNALSTDQFYQTQNDAVQATNSTYAQIRGQGYYGQALWSMDIMADNSFLGGGGASDGIDFQQLDNYTIPSSNPLITAMFQRSYLGIGACNQVLTRVPGITDIDPAIQNRCLGEAEFMRAFYYFSLTRLFGDVPLVLTPAPNPDAIANVGRDPAATIYAQVEKDLLDAITKLPATNYTGDDVGRANKWSATALLAKVYLTEGKMAEAATQAQAVISGSGKSLWANYGDNFKLENENGQESLFEVQYKQGLNAYTFDGPGSAINEFWGARFFGNPYVVSGGGYGFNIPEKEFVDGYEAGDKRKAATIFVPGDEYTDGPKDSKGNVQVQPAKLDGDPNGYNVRKFYAGTASTIWDSPLNVPVLRLAEMYLILAEANMNTGKMADGLTALNVVRKRAGLPNATALNLDVILKERRYELAFEMDRWYDLKRTKTLVNNPNLLSKGIKPFNDLLPIPQAERDVNPNLGQNPGY